MTEKPAKRRQLTPEQQRARAAKRAQAQEQAQSAPTSPVNPSPSIRETKSSSSNLRFTAVVVFLGSLFGTLLGTVTSINDFFDSLSRVDELLNPPTQLCVAGSNTILGAGLGMAADWENDYENLNVDVNVDINGTGSVDGVRLAAAGGCVDVLAMSEPITGGQQELLAEGNVEIECAAEIGYDVIAFVTDSNNTLPSLLERLMANVLTGRATNWDDVRGDDQTIFIYARPGSGTTDYVLREFGWQLGERQLPPNANYLECTSNSACLDLTLSTPGSLYWVSTSWMRTQPEQYLRVLPILRGDERPINPLRDNFDIRQYPDKLVRPLYMYVLRSANADTETEATARHFLNYIRGVRGQQILEDHFFYNHFNRPEGVDVPLPGDFTFTTSGPRQLCRTA